jgi:hypothetical protein
MGYPQALSKMILYLPGAENKESLSEMTTLQPVGTTVGDHAAERAVQPDCQKPLMDDMGRV